MSSRFQYCSSLRSRVTWNTLIPSLIRSKSPQWKEATISTHDIELPIPKPADAPRRTLCGIFLEPDDMGCPGTDTRLERLFHLNGGRDAVVVFHMKAVNQSNNAMEAFLRLQISMMGSREMHVLPIDSVDAAIKAIFSYQRSLSVAGRPQKHPNPVQHLLPYCSQAPVPNLSDHTVNVLTDVTSGFQDLLDQLSTEEGQNGLSGYLGDDADQILSFWDDEYLAE